ncbi:MAG TPA: response regulator transcription factor [Cellvibrionaceae bacterium]|nr:response regulator transcription factor [Cellvibrionaceae bacterium]HMW46776.1 response regulator transcription factor [Cellvibrionaceae bacterium]HMW72477.1 response regulator transcription factor [Cellvibrionaceae bacterium]HMY38034.1 response regulator transcription factor [Marinagarivorans sp.]HNG59561.1 response regulator transcription factor [Cellvibrionaceae bacterium]
MTVSQFPPIKKRRFLIVEDELDLAKLLVLHLQDFNADITCIDRGDVALQVAQKEPWDLLILDLRLPGLDGLEVCRQLRAKAVEVPLLMLTARSAELDRVLGLELGADDYLTKPFSAMELVARVKALLRRAGRHMAPPAATELLRFKHMSIDRGARSVTLGGKVIELTAREFDLLWFFASNPGRVFRRGELLDSVWGYGHEGYEHTVNSHINRLRAKIEADAANPEVLLTVWGVGYKFNEECA